MEFHQIKRDELKNWIGKPVWYQNLENINDFGWAFIHPETVKLQDGGAQLGYCKLIMTDKWFDEYMFRLVVEKKYVPADILKLLDSQPVMLPAWDPMFLPEE